MNHEFSSPEIWWNFDEQQEHDKLPRHSDASPEFEKTRANIPDGMPEQSVEEAQYLADYLAPRLYRRTDNHTLYQMHQLEDVRTSVAEPQTQADRLHSELAVAHMRDDTVLCVGPKDSYADVPLDSLGAVASVSSDSEFGQRILEEERPWLRPGLLSEIVERSGLGAQQVSSADAVLRFYPRFSENVFFRILGSLLGRRGGGGGGGGGGSTAAAPPTTFPVDVVSPVSNLRVHYRPSGHLHDNRGTVFGNSLTSPVSGRLQLANYCFGLIGQNMAQICWDSSNFTVNRATTAYLLFDPYNCP